MSALIIVFIVSVVAMSIPLWVAAKLTGVDLSMVDALIAAAASSALSLIPGGIGWVLSVIALYYILQKMTGAPTFPDLILMVIVSKLVAFMGAMAIVSFLSK